MPALVVPFRGVNDKSRLWPASEQTRSALALAMLGDVLSACTPVGRTRVVTGVDEETAAAITAAFEVELVADPGRGQGDAVGAAVAGLEESPILVVNADLPCVTSRDLLALAGAMPPGGMALAPAADGTTNALALAAPWLFAPLYGPNSAERFLERAARLEVDAVVAEIPNLAEDADSLADLERLEEALGSWTGGSLAALRTGSLT